jgi:hypothetical protein
MVNDFSFNSDFWSGNISKFERGNNLVDVFNLFER